MLDTGRLMMLPPLFVLPAEMLSAAAAAAASGWLRWARQLQRHARMHTRTHKTAQVLNIKWTVFDIKNTGSE